MIEKPLSLVLAALHHIHLPHMHTSPASASCTTRCLVFHLWSVPGGRSPVWLPVMGENPWSITVVPEATVGAPRTISCSGLPLHPPLAGRAGGTLPEMGWLYPRGGRRWDGYIPEAGWLYPGGGGMAISRRRWNGYIPEEAGWLYPSTTPVEPGNPPVKSRPGLSPAVLLSHEFSSVYLSISCLLL